MEEDGRLAVRPPQQDRHEQIDEPMNQFLTKSTTSLAYSDTLKYLSVMKLIGEAVYELLGLQLRQICKSNSATTKCYTYDSLSGGGEFYCVWWCGMTQMKSKIMKRGGDK